MGGLPDQPGGDQTQSQSLSGQCVFAVVVVRHTGFSSFPPVSTSCLSSAGLHPAHALKRRRTPQKTAAGPKGKRAPLFHTMLPRLGCFQNSPLLNQLARKKMLMCLPPCYSLQIPRCLHPTVLNLSFDLTPTSPSPNLQQQNWHEFMSLLSIKTSFQIKRGMYRCFIQIQAEFKTYQRVCCSPLSGLQGALEDHTQQHR